MIPSSPRGPMIGDDALGSEFRAASPGVFEQHRDALAGDLGEDGLADRKSSARVAPVANARGDLLEFALLVLPEDEATRHRSDRKEDLEGLLVDFVERE